MKIAEPAPPRAEIEGVERRLVELACEGDPEAREELAQRCGRAAFRFAMVLVSEREVASDLSQDALLRFFATLPSFDVSRPVLPWLFRIVRNRLADMHRRERTPAGAALRFAVPIEDWLPVTDRFADPLGDIERLELQQLVWRCLDQLKLPHREIIALRDFQDLSYREIATVLEIPMGTVMSRLHAARMALRGHLLETGYHFGERR